VIALENKNPQFAVGAVSGSSIVVCTVALGACLWIGARARNSGAFQLQAPVKKQCLVLMLSAIFPLAIPFFGFNLLLGAFGAIYYLGFLIYSLTANQGISDKTDEDLEQGTTEEVPVKKGVMYLILGGVLIFIFSKPFITSVVNIAAKLKVNPMLLAFFLAPIASEMPEILESISLSRKGSAQNINIAFSNLVGGTITKTTLLCGILSWYGVIKEFEFVSPNYSVSLTLLAICAIAASSIGYFFHKQTHWHGLMLFVCFVLCGSLQYYFNYYPIAATLAPPSVEVTSASVQNVV